MSRRSARLKVKAIARIKAVAEDVEPPISDSEYYDPEPGSDRESSKPATSRRVRRARDGRKEANRKTIKGKRGILQRMPGMPLDVLFEVGSTFPTTRRSPNDVVHRFLPTSVQWIC